MAGASTPSIGRPESHRATHLNCRRAYIWDKLDALIGQDHVVTAAKGGGESSAWENWSFRYVYTADGERIWYLESDAGVAEALSRFTIRDLDGQPLTTFSFENNTTSWEMDYIYRGGGQLLASESAEPYPDDTWHYTLNHLGTPSIVHDTNGNTVGSQWLWAFGEKMVMHPNLERQRRKFTGHEREWSFENPGASAFDRETDDLDYMHARYYSPFLGRFLSVDPATSASALRPQSWNQYSYVLNNPLGLVDPSGETAIPFDLILQASVKTADFLSGFGSGVSNHSMGGGDNVGKKRSTAAYRTGNEVGDFASEHPIPTVVEGTYSPFPYAVVGASCVNGTDCYAVGGFSSEEAGNSISFGIVGNYDGPGSFGGDFMSISTPGPVSLSYSFNPNDPKGSPKALTLTFSSPSSGSILPSVSRTYYQGTRVYELVQKARSNRNGGVFFLEGSIIRIAGAE